MPELAVVEGWTCPCPHEGTDCTACKHKHEAVDCPNKRAVRREYVRTERVVGGRQRPAERPARAPHPPPEVRARSATADEITLSPRKIMKAATAAGWLVSATYSRGTLMTADGNVAQRLKKVPNLDPEVKEKYNMVPQGPKVADVLVVRARRGEGRVAGRWYDGSIDIAYVWRLGVSPTEVTVTRLEELVKLDQLAFYAEIPGVKTPETTEEPDPR